MRQTRLKSERAAQHGAATLVVVMVLFFIMAMMAAYANRNLIFEQRISANYYRSTIAFEMAESGLEWATALINAGVIDAQCNPSATPGGTSFRSRYLNVSDTGSITEREWVDGEGAKNALLAGCARTSTDTVCHCASSSGLSLPASTDTTVRPMFSVSFKKLSQPGSVRLVAEGCTDIGSQCNGGAEGSSNSDAHATTSIVLSLVSALKLPPTAPLTASGDIDLSFAQFRLINTAVQAGGVTARWGGNLTADAANQFISLPGAPAAASQAKDEAMWVLRGEADKTFAKYFGMFQTTYRDQPAVTQLTCDADCGPQLNSAWAGGARLIWVRGDLSISSPVALGTVTDPVVLIADGTLRISGASTLTGLVYANGDAEWVDALSPQSALTGALVTRGRFTGQGAAQLRYDPEVMSRLNLKAGSFVRVPGSWTDLK